MKNLAISTNPFAVVMLLAGWSLLASCQTYRYGYWGKLPVSGTHVPFEKDLVTRVMQISDPLVIQELLKQK